MKAILLKNCICMFPNSLNATDNDLHCLFKKLSLSYFCGARTAWPFLVCAKSSESLRSQAMGHSFHQMSPMQEPTVLYNTVIHLHQWLQKNEIETCRQHSQLLLWPALRGFDALNSRCTQQSPIRKRRQIHREKKLFYRFKITSWSKRMLFLFYVPSARSQVGMHSV